MRRSWLLILGFGLGACNGETIVTDTGPFDQDEDGSWGLADCDDADADVYPGAVEACDDGKDNDCDGVVDEGKSVFHLDYDDDGYGDDERTTEACSRPSGYVIDGGDCDDTEASTNPEGAESCDGIDNDCDGVVDEDDAIDAATWYFDFDSDGHGGSLFTTEACVAPVNYVEGQDDCDDTDPGVNPSATEICDDGVDNDCDGGANDCSLSGVLALVDADARLFGNAAGDQAGAAVTGAGDFDGDGRIDVVIGAPGEGDSLAERGSSYVLFGPLNHSIRLSYADLILRGEAAGDRAGAAVSGGGDFDDDGFDDVAVGAPGESGAGAVYVVHGGSETGDVDLSCWSFDSDNDTGSPCAEAPAVARLMAEDLDHGAGAAVSFAGDVDDDGGDELLVGAPGADGGGTGSGGAYLVAGPLTGSMSLADATARLFGESSSDGAGSSVNAAGDLDGDGFDDVVVGAPFNDHGGTDAGRAYVLRGPIGNDLNLSTADILYAGQSAGDLAGTSVASAGDVDGDGLPDLLIGAPGAVGALSTDALGGAAYLVLAPGSDASLADADARLAGGDPNIAAGIRVSSAGDVNHDGFDDLLIGSGDPDGTQTDRSAAFLVLGPITGQLDLNASDALFRGAGSRDYLLYDVAGVGDVDDDGNDDLLIGGLGDDTNGAEAGGAFLFLGVGL